MQPSSESGGRSMETQSPCFSCGARSAKNLLAETVGSFNQRTRGQ